MKTQSPRRRNGIRAGAFAGVIGLLGLLLGAHAVAGIPAPGSPDVGFRPWFEEAGSDGVWRPGEVACLAVQGDGRILAGGRFGRVNGVGATHVVRLLSDGSVDTSFVAGVDAAGTVLAVVVRPDGRIWLGGGFTRVDGERRVGLARLNADGTLDGRFELIPEMQGEVHALALEEDGRLLFGGRFSLFDLPLRQLRSVARLAVNGTLDDGFAGSLLTPEVLEQFGDADVTGIFPQPGGRVVLRARHPVAEAGSAALWAVQADGQRDWDAFGYYQFSRRVLRVCPGRGARLLVCDRGEASGPVVGSAIRRLRADGDWDPAFAVWNDATMSAAVELPDGRAVLAGFGAFLGPGPAADRNVVRLREDGTVEPAFGWGTRVRGGVGVMALEPGGTVLLGGAIEGVNDLPLAGLCRLHGGEAEGPVIREAPQGGTRVAGTETVLRVVATGTEPLSFQWRNAGKDLPDETNAILRIPGVRVGEAHLYSIQVSNLAGMATSGPVRLNVIEATRIVSQPESLVFRPGDQLGFAVEAAGPAPLTFAWYRDGNRLPGADGKELVLTNLSSADIGEYWAEVSGPGGIVASARATLRARVIQPGDTDPSFAPGSGTDGRVVSLAVTGDGRVLLGGAFSNVAGLPRRGVAWLQTNGTPDPAFVPRLPEAVTVSAVAAAGNGRAWVAGAVGKDFQARAYVAGLDPGGFLVGEAFPGVGSGVAVLTLGVQAGERVVVGGTFQWQAGPAHAYVNLARLQSGLEPDLSFPTNLGLDGVVLSLAVDGEGRVVIGGTFTRVQGQRRAAVARLLPGGELDPAFDAGEVRYLTGPGSIHRLALSPDGACVVLGTFDHVGGHPARSVARLGVDGRVDVGFRFGLGTTMHEEVRAVCVLSNGWPVLAGRFDPYRVGGITASVLRMNPAGEIDATFGPQLGLSPDVACLAVQHDQKLVVGGEFTSDYQVRQRGITRLRVGESFAPFFVREPEDVLTTPGADALLWAQAEGTRQIGYQWEKDGRPLATATSPPLMLRGLGAADEGRYQLVASNGVGIGRSRSVRVRILAVPEIDALSSNRTVVAGGRVEVAVTARGGEPRRYQWTRDGVSLPRVDGPVVVLDPVTGADAGAYQVTVANELRSVRSPVSRLTVVVPPRITGLSGERSVRVGDPVAVEAVAVGTGPLSYGWRKDGRDVAGATNARVELAAATRGDAGEYRVTVTNAWGAATSAPVRVEVLVPPVLVVRPPGDRTVAVGGTVVWEAEVGGWPYPRLQWLWEGREIPGAEGPVLVLTNVGPARAGSYSLMAGSIAGTARSPQSRLIVGEVTPALTDVHLEVQGDGTFVVEGAARVGAYEVEVSEDLRDWETVWSGRVTDGRLRFVEPGAEARDRRFLRIRYGP